MSGANVGDVLQEQSEITGASMVVECSGNGDGQGIVGEKWKEIVKGKAISTEGQQGDYNGHLRVLLKSPNSSREGSEFLSTNSNKFPMKESSELNDNKAGIALKDIPKCSNSFGILEEGMDGANVVSKGLGLNSYLGGDGRKGRKAGLSKLLKSDFVMEY